MGFIDFFKQAWSWYIAGPLIGLIVPLLLLLGNKDFGISSNLRHACAIIPNKIAFFQHNWRKEGSWNLVFFLGVIVGGFLAAIVFANPNDLQLANSTTRDLQALGVEANGSFAPDIFSWAGLLSLKGFLLMVGGGFLIGFGSAYAGGCTSGHSILGLANFQLPSLIATLGFFIGGLISTHLLLPLVLTF